MKFPLYSEDSSNQFGDPNSLDTTGGLFDTLPEKESRSQSDQPPSDRASESDLPSGGAPVEEEEPKPVIQDKAPVSGNSGRKSDKAQPRKKKSALLPMIAGMILLAAVACIAVLLGTNVFIGGRLISRNTVELDLSESSFGNYSGLSQLKKLEKLDLSSSSFEDLSALYGCKNLKSVVLKDKTFPAEDCIEFYKNVPGAMLDCKVDIDGQIFDSDTSEAVVIGKTKETQLLYGALHNLKTLDLTGCAVSGDTFIGLSGMLPDCVVKSHLAICGGNFSSDAENVSVNGKLTDSDIEILSHFRNLKVLDLLNCDNPDAAQELLKRKPDLEVWKNITILNKTVSTKDELVDLRGDTYTIAEVRAAFRDAIPQMKRLKKIDMCGCGLSNEEMSELCGEYPDIKLVWIIHLKFWDVRTDAVIFSSLNGRHFSPESVYEPLFTYCTDLIALDLGHNLMTDISKITSLKKLKSAILMDNKLTDISPLAELKDIEFLEMNINRINSLEPLRNLDNLMYLDVWSSMDATDLSPLYNHKNLKIAIFHKSVPGKERKQFRESNPDCQTFYNVDSVKVTTNEEWRSTKYRQKLKYAFTNWKYVVGYDEETGDYIFDFNTDQYKYM